MSNEFKRTPTCGENDVDLRVATEPRRTADRLTASIQFHELAQGYRAATPDGAQAAYEKLCAFLEGRAAGEDRNSVIKQCTDIARCYDLGTPEGHAIADAIEASFAPQPVDAAQAVPEDALPIMSEERITAIATEMALNVAKNASVAPQLCFPHIYLGLKDLFATAPVAQPTDTTKGA